MGPLITSLYFYRNAKKQEIVKAYRKLAMQWHPDNFQDEEEKKQAEKKFIDIAAAKEVLTDPGTSWLRELVFVLLSKRWTLACFECDMLSEKQQYCSLNGVWWLLHPPFLSFPNGHIEGQGRQLSHCF